MKIHEFELIATLTMMIRHPGMHPAACLEKAKDLTKMMIQAAPMAFDSLERTAKPSNGPVKKAAGAPKGM